MAKLHSDKDPRVAGYRGKRMMPRETDSEKEKEQKGRKKHRIGVVLYLAWKSKEDHGVLYLHNTITFSIQSE